MQYGCLKAGDSLRRIRLKLSEGGCLVIRTPPSWLSSQQAVSEAYASASTSSNYRADGWVPAHVDLSTFRYGAVLAVHHISEVRYHKSSVQIYD